jgi:hypothetical protein
VYLPNGANPLSDGAAEEEIAVAPGACDLDSWFQDHLADLFAVFMSEWLAHWPPSLRELDAALSPTAALLTAAAFLRHWAPQRAAFVIPPLLP